MQKLVSCALASLLLLAGCAFPGVYKINVQQGNIVKKVDLAKLKSGMTPKEVHYVLGQPLAKDSFDPSRDYYIYTFQKHGGKTREQKIVIYYKDGHYDRYSAQLLAKTPAY